MSASEPWASLGLAPTADIRAIRSAYAVRLKQIDVDADPEAFRTLRERHDWALHLAHAMATDTDALEQHKMQIWQLLTDENYGPWHSTRIAAETRALLELPILENIDVTAETEHWLAAVIAQTIPRSDPMVAMTVNHFGWERLEGKVGGFYGLHHALQRRKDIDCSARLRQPDHRWHQAFLYLQQPPQPAVSADEKRKIGNHINALLESIRFHNPTVEAELNADHVAQWDGLIGQAIEQKQAIEPIRSSTWKDVFGLIPFWGWIVIFYIVAALLLDS